MIRKSQSIHMYWFHACLNKLTCYLVQNMTRYYLRSQMSLNFEPLVQNGPNPYGCSCISPTHSFCHVMITHHIVHCIDRVYSLFVGNCPPSVDVVPAMRWMAPMKSHIIF